MYSLDNLKTLALHNQHLTKRDSSSKMLDMIKDIGCLQIDTLQVVKRSHYIVLWSRLGNYDTNAIDNLLFPEDQNSAKLFEYWLHCASIIPFDFYKYRSNKRKFYANGESPWFKKWLSKKENLNLMDDVFAFVQKKGSVTTKDFDDSKKKRSGWWDWKPSKKALEQLYNRGDLMIKGRPKFKRLYDIKQNVIPKGTDTSTISIDEERIFWLDLGAKALGACLPMQLADYTYMKRTVAKPYIKSLIEKGTLIEIEAELTDQKKHTLVVHKSNLTLLKKIKDEAIKATKTTFLSPFDSLFWAKKRDQLFWNFDQTLEAYKKQEDRKWGYFCLPILHKNNLVGRIDPKVDKKNKRLIIKSFWLEDQTVVDDELIMSVKKAMQSFMDFHNVEQLSIEFSSSPIIKQKLTEG